MSHAPSTDIAYLESVHRALEEKLTALTDGRYVTPTEQLKVTELKKRKLSTKDRITELRARQAHP